MDEDLILRTIRKNPNELVSFYAQAKTQEAKSDLASWIGAFCKEQGLLALVDYLYSQGLNNNRIRAILKKYPLFADFSLESTECDAIISVMLSFLVTPYPIINSSDDEEKFKVDLLKRESAARILVVLNGYQNTSSESKARIQEKYDLPIAYHCIDRMHDVFVIKVLYHYLSGDVR